MIKINKSDSIIDIIIKINHLKDEKVVLDFPFWHPILHNYTSLRILKNNCKKRELIIITSDITAKKIWKKVWITYSLVQKKDLLEYNYTFSEYLKYLTQNYLNDGKNFILNNRYNKDILSYRKKIKNKKSRIWYFLFWLIISILLLIFIFYFAVNKTYVYITPEITIKTRAKNLTFKELKEGSTVINWDIIKLNKISKLIYLTNTFWTSGVNEDEISRSSWEVIFTNELFEKIRLIAHTRVQTQEWLIYTIGSSIDIPPAIKNSSWSLIPGTKKATITAQIYDTQGKIIWKRWNIKKGVNLDLPWLKVNSDKIYAKTIHQITWWNNNFEKIVSKDDLINAKNILESQLKSSALEQLKNEVSLKNKNNNITYSILWIDNIITYDQLNISGSEEIKPGDKIDNFKLSGTIRVTSYTYNNQLVLTKLKNTIKDNLLDEIEKILFVDNSSLRIADVLNSSQFPFTVKASAEVEVFFIHNFLSETNNYVDKLKHTIAWMDKDEAVNILLNNSKISNVRIETRPFFIKKISNIPNNIIFKVVEK